MIYRVRSGLIIVVLSVFLAGLLAVGALPFAAASLTRVLAAPPTDCTGVTEIPTSECNVLIDLYRQTDGPHWEYNNGWTTATPCSTPWWGIYCALGHVTKIDLAQNNLIGTLPTTLNHFTGLQYLDLSVNALSGSIPDLSGFVSLLHLDLSSNALSGSIPSLSDLVTLQYLELSNNALSGSIPSLSGLYTLQILDMSRNALSGTIPPLSSRTLLVLLGLSNNHLSGPIPDLSNLTYLTYLYLSNNALSGPIPDLSNLTNLKVLYLDYNQLSGFVPASITSTAIETALTFDNLTLCGGSNHLTPPNAATDAWIVERDTSWTCGVGCMSSTDTPMLTPTVTF